MTSNAAGVRFRYSLATKGDVPCRAFDPAVDTLYLGGHNCEDASKYILASWRKFPCLTCLSGSLLGSKPFTPTRRQGAKSKRLSECGIQMYPFHLYDVLISAANYFYFSVKE